MAAITKDGCVFCGIANGGVNLIWENDYAAAFPSNSSVAPVHILVIPKAHVETIDDLNDPELAAAMLLAVRDTARAVGVNRAYKLIVNNGRASGQSVPHLHFHILARKDGAEFSFAGTDL